jgi:4-hydroxy-tetrahydrodipicolinate synthase
MTKSKISGIITLLVIPMTKDLDLDGDALRKLIEHVVKGGVMGIFLLGTNGECASLTLSR